MQPNNEEIGKAFLAYQAYNHKAKTFRLGSFDLHRWVKVIRALEGGPVVKQGWSAARRKKFMQTVAAKRKANGSAAHA